MFFIALKSGCCEWCNEVAGVYEYPGVPKDVWRRHDRCKCIIDYVTNEGRLQHLSGDTKAWGEIDAEELERRKTIGLETSRGRDVTAEYFGTARPGEGRVAFEAEYLRTDKEHADERAAAKWLHGNFGGDITLRADRERGHPNPDINWRKIWEIKTLSTNNTNTIDKHIQDGVNQILENSGGILIDFTRSKLSLDGATEIVDRQAYVRVKETIDIIIKKGEKCKVMRYIKR